MALNPKGRKVRKGKFEKKNSLRPRRAWRFKDLVLVWSYFSPSTIYKSDRMRVYEYT
jgi:hypothetical protein